MAKSRDCAIPEKCNLECKIYLSTDPSVSGITGSNNLMIHYGLQNTYNKFCKKEGKEELSAFLPNLPGYIDTPGMQDNRSGLL